jgi:hypothetical protein
MREQTILSTYEDFKIAPTTNRWKASDPPETKVTYRLPGDGRVFRFRALAKPPAAIQTGLYVRPDLSVVGGVMTHTGDSDLVASFTIPGPLTASSNYYISVPVDGAPIPVATATLGAPGFMPFNGQQRYWQRIIANALTDGTGTAFLYGVTGTVTITAGGTRVIGAGTLFQSEFEVGRQIEINGERRNVAFIGSNTDLEVDAPFTTGYGPGIALRDPRYRYAFEVGDTGNEWYTTQEADITFKEAGNDDAGHLGTAMYDASGERPICIATMQNRLLVQFSAALQAWGIGSNAKTDMKLLAIDGQAAGIHTAPQAALIDGLTALPTANGVRLFNPTGNNKDYIEFVGVGDMLRGITLPNLTRAIWWPALRTYLTCASSTDGDTTFYCLTSHKDTKALGWETFSFRGITAVDSMFLRGNDLVIVQNYRLYIVSILDLTFRDDNDTDLPFESRGRTMYCDLGSPNKNKKVIDCDIVQTGGCRLAIYMNPYREEELAFGPTVSGTTFGRQRCDIGVEGPGIGVEFTSTDATGHEMDAVAFTYQLLNR